MSALTLVFAALLVCVLAVSNSLACESALSLIEKAEGFRACTYTDTTGHKTICYGFNLATSGAKEKVEQVGGDFAKVWAGGCLTQHQCAELLESEVKLAAAAEHHVFGSICSCIDAVLTDMTYNLGEAGIESFTTFRSLIAKREWSAAANDLKGTLWCRQVGSRCTRNVGIIAHGC
jgi:GH24 family phage-related lysozyme (muramidase)